MARYLSKYFFQSIWLLFLNLTCSKIFSKKGCRYHSRGFLFFMHPCLATHWIFATIVIIRRHSFCPSHWDLFKIHGFLKNQRFFNNCFNVLGKSFSKSYSLLKIDRRFTEKWCEFCALKPGKFKPWLVWVSWWWLVPSSILNHQSIYGIPKNPVSVFPQKGQLLWTTSPWVTSSRLYFFAQHETFQTIHYELVSKKAPGVCQKMCLLEKK